MPIPMNYFNIQPLPSNHVGTVCYTRKTPFPGRGFRDPERIPAARNLVPRGFPHRQHK
jgi:hypothetical protein